MKSIKPSFRFWCQWINPFKASSFNWIDFTFFNFSFEWGKYKGRYLEITLCVLGLGVEVELAGRMSRAVWGADMDQRIAEHKDEIERMKEDGTWT